MYSIVARIRSFKPMSVLIFTTLFIYFLSSDARASSYKVRVVSSTPIFEVANQPSTKIICENVALRQRSRVPPVVGAIAGGVIGSNIGGKRSVRRINSIIGAVVGSSIGRRVSERTASVRTQRQCREVTEFRSVQSLKGYRVNYRFKGQIFSTFRRNEPGRFIRIRGVS